MPPKIRLRPKANQDSDDEGPSDKTKKTTRRKDTGDFSKEITNSNSEYSLVSGLGQGSYGKIVLARSKANDKLYAIKTNFVNSKVDGIGRLIELQIMEQIRHEFITSAVEVFLGESPLDRKILPGEKLKRRATTRQDNCYIMMDLAKCNLDSLISTNYIQVLNDLPRIMVSLLLGLEYLHAKGICHRDIRPDNILVFEDEIEGIKYYTYKLGDFGLGKSLDPFLGNTTTIINRYFRPPEIACSCKNYNKSVDIWCMGILFFCLFTLGENLYSPSYDDDEEVLSVIHELVSLENIDYPDCDLELLNKIKKRKSPNRLLPLLKNKLSKRALEKFSNPDDVYDIFVKMLSPSINRITASELLNHPVFNSMKEIFITKCREFYQISSDGRLIGNGDLIVSKSDAIRNHVMNIMIDIYNDNTDFSKKNSDFYTHQVWCATIDLFDRWYCQKFELTGDLEIDKENARKVLYVCLYMIVKILSISKNYRFNDIANGTGYAWSNELGELEFEIVKTYAKEGIYRRTIYDYLKNFKDRDMPVIVRFYRSEISKYHGNKVITIARSLENQILKRDETDSLSSMKLSSTQSH